MTTIQKIYLLLFVLFLASIPAWRYFVVPELLKIPNDFSLSIDYYSVGNEYDVKNNSFLGEIISQSILDVQIKSIQDGVIVLDSTFESQTLSGGILYRNTREYSADISTGKSILDQRLKQRGINNEWTILPKHLEKKSYVYHFFERVDPVKFDFIKEDKVLGLLAYHYRGTDSLDSSAIFADFDPYVSVDRGVKNSVEAEMWVEPVSGTIVQFKESGINNYINRVNGQDLYPRDIYKNTFSDDTIANQVRLAQNEKQKIILYERWMPILLGLISLAFLIALFASRKVALKSRNPN
jgi:hypothetical protein